MRPKIQENKQYDLIILEKNVHLFGGQHDIAAENSDPEAKTQIYADLEFQTEHLCSRRRKELLSCMSRVYNVSKKSWTILYGIATKWIGTRLLGQTVLLLRTQRRTEGRGQDFNYR